MFLATLLVLLGPPVLVAPAVLAAIRARRWFDVLGLVGLAAFLAGAGLAVLRLMF